MMITNEVLDLLILKTQVGSLKIDKDFEKFTDRIAQALHMTPLHINTWKRIFGQLKVKEGYQPSNQTLQIIANYLGCKDWKALSENIQDIRRRLSSRPDSRSNILLNRNMEARMLSLRKGDVVQVSYFPECFIEAEYQGNNQFRVMNTRHTSLKKDDVFLSFVFLPGESFHAMRIRRNGVLLGDIHTEPSEYIQDVQFKRLAQAC